MLGDIIRKLVAGFVHEGFVVKIIELGHGSQAGKVLVKQIVLNTTAPTHNDKSLNMKKRGWLIVRE